VVALLATTSSWEGFHGTPTTLPTSVVWSTGLVLGALVAGVAPHHDQPTRRLAVLVPVLVAVVGGAAWLNHSRSYIVHTERGNAFLWENKPDQAVAELQAALQQRPDYLPAHFGLAHAYSNRKTI